MAMNTKQTRHMINKTRNLLREGIDASFSQAHDTRGEENDVAAGPINPRVKAIYDRLTTQTFVDFYGQVPDYNDSPMSKHIMGSDDAPSKEEIYKEIDDTLYYDTF